MMQAIGYVRRSTDRQDESLEQQRAKLQSYAVSKGWELVEVYVDDAISGSEMDRPGLTRLMHRAREDGNVQAVVMWDRNRLARPKDPVDGLMLERQLMSTGKRIIYVGSGTEPDRSFTSGLISYIENHQNGDYLRKLSRDVARGIIAQVRRRLWPGGPIPFGYDRVILDAQGTPRKVVRNNTDGSLSIVAVDDGHEIERLAQGLRFRKQPHEQVTLTLSEPGRVQAVRQMFSDYAAGVPTRVIRDRLNAAGLRTTFSGLFAIPSINCILENPAYTGKSVYNRRTESKWHRLLNGSSTERHDEGLERRPESDWIVVDDAWPAIVDADTFARVQARRKDSRQRHRYATGSSIKANYLLTGLGFCGVCGSRLTGYTCTSGKGIKTSYYVCSGHHRSGKDRCPKRYLVPARPVEDRIIRLIADDLQRLSEHPDLTRYIAQELQRINGSKAHQCNNLTQHLADVDRQQNKLRDHLLSLDAKTAQAMGLYDQARKLAEQRETLQHQLAQAAQTCVNVPSEAVIRTGTSDALSLLQRAIAQGTLEEKREVIAHYVHRLETNPATQQVKIHLYPAVLSRKIGVGGFEPPTS